MDELIGYQIKDCGTGSELDASDDSSTESVLVETSRTETSSANYKHKPHRLIQRITSSSSSSENEQIILDTSDSENEQIILDTSDSENEKIVSDTSDSENENDKLCCSSLKKNVRTLSYSSASNSSQEEFKYQRPEGIVTTQHCSPLKASSHQDVVNINENSLLVDDSLHSSCSHPCFNSECNKQDVLVTDINHKSLPFVHLSNKDMNPEDNIMKKVICQTDRDNDKNIESSMLKMSNSTSSKHIGQELAWHDRNKRETSSDECSVVLMSGSNNHQIKIDQNATYKNGNENKLAKSTFIPSSTLLKQPFSSAVNPACNIETKLQSLSIVENKKQNLIVDTSDTVVERNALHTEIETLTKELLRAKSILKTVNISNLPDRGVRLQLSISENEKRLKIKREELIHLESCLLNVSEKELSTATNQDAILPSCSNFPKLPYGMGKRALETHIFQKSLTVDALKHLHGSLKSCPSEDVFADDPKGLKSDVALMPHQRHALAWMSWREKQIPPSGILADDMGLGKTLTMISLVLKCLEEQENESSDEDEDIEESEKKYEKWDKKVETGGTLIVCPASLLSQWAGEVKLHCKQGVLAVEIHHGAGREKKARRLARYDLVVTTFSIVRVEAGIRSGKKGDDEIDPVKGVLHRMKWKRIILDEAHVVRNFKSQQSVAVCQLRAKHRWALTGTPIHNKELDLYALLKFLKVAPFDDYQVWRRWVDNKNAAGLKRLNTVMNSIMLRRTKDVLREKGSLTCLPEKNTHVIYVTLDKEEFSVYKKVLVFSRTLFAQFLNQKAEKEGESLYSNNGIIVQGKQLANAVNLNSEMSAMQMQLGKSKVKAYEVLVLLLRLRQICCHPGLIKAMLDNESHKAEEIEDNDGLDMVLLEKLGGMNLQDNASENDLDADEVEKEVLSCTNPVFNFDRLSSKMRTVLAELSEKVLGNGDKAVIVSQWTSMLKIMGDHLSANNINCERLDGSVPVKDRMDIVEQFNKSSSGSQVLLLSLTAGGVGLNLIGANHLFLIDLHWNPQLEAQACDRVHRVGQKKIVHIYKFVCQDTVEQRIKILQDRKLTLATGILIGARNHQTSKLSLDDLKLLFSM